MYVYLVMCLYGFICFSGCMLFWLYAYMVIFLYIYIYIHTHSGLRFFTVYGPRGRPDMAPFKFLDQIYRGQTIDQFGDGSTSRDYTYVEDIVDGIIRTSTCCAYMGVYILACVYVHIRCTCGVSTCYWGQTIDQFALRETTRVCGIYIYTYIHTYVHVCITITHNRLSRGVQSRLWVPHIT